VDPLAILAGLGVDSPESVTAVSGGWDTALWRVDTQDRAYALRVFRPEQAETCRREALVMRTLSGMGLPVPGVYAEGVGEGRPALLLSWCRGQTVLQELQQHPWRIWHLGVAMGRTQNRIHGAPLSEALRRALPAWSPRADEAPQALGALLRAAPAGSIALLHLDYHPLNVMSDGRRLTGVLDWANVAIGDRRADLARTITILRLAPLPPGTPAVFRWLTTILELAWRTGYRDGERVDPFGHLGPFYAWAGAMMERDLRPKLGRPGVWLQQSDLARINRWTSQWIAHEK
jgi:aminoglycoside phosphotransferase (APT) family kinase protein